MGDVTRTSRHQCLRHVKEREICGYNLTINMSVRRRITGRQATAAQTSCIRESMAGQRDDVRLLGAWPSPFVMRASFALKFKKVPYEFVETDAFRKTELLLRTNPVYKKIPVLLHGDRAVCESMIIVEYVDSVWECDGPSLLPSDPYDLAVARFWCTVVDNKLMPSLMAVAKAETEEDKATATEQLLETLKLFEDAFEKCSKGKAFFGGDAIGLLDISLGSLVAWLRVAERKAGEEFLCEEKTPLLAGWAARFCAEEAAKEVVPDTDKLLDFFQNVVVQRWNAGKPSAK